MTLGDELRAALYQEAELQSAGGPDTERLILGGQVRRRRRTRSRIGGAALAAVLVGGGVYAVAQGDPGDTGSNGIATQDTGTPEPTGIAAPPELPGDRDPLEPETYRVVVGLGVGGPQIRADLTLDGPGWFGGDYPVVYDGAYAGGIGVYKPWSIAAGSGCADDVVSVDLGSSPQALARRLAQLPASTVVQPVTRTTVLGLDAWYLRVQFPDVLTCTKWYQVAQTPRGSRGISFDGASPGVLMNFWVVEVDGVPVVIDSWHQTGAPARLNAQVMRALNSITFVSGT